MKKINLFLLAIMLFFLSSCQLATNVPEEIEYIEDYYIPTEVHFNLQKINESETIDISDYIYFSWTCDEQGLDLMYTCVRYGSSMEPVSQIIQSHTNTLNGVEEPSVITITIVANIYISSELNNTVLYPNVTLETVDGKLRIEPLIGAVIGGGLITTNTLTGIFDNGEVLELILELHFIAIDELQMLEIREYDNEDNLLKITQITEDELVEELNLLESTEYAIIIETYKDGNGELYTSRDFLNKDDINYLKYKFLNDEGFIDEDEYLFIKFYE